MKRYRGPEDDQEVNVTPLLDVVFILLIFFIVHSTLATEQGLDIKGAQGGPAPQGNPAIIYISASDLLLFEGAQISQETVRPRLVSFRSASPLSALIIAADGQASTAMLVAVLDAAGQAGFEDVSVAPWSLRD